MPAEDVAGAAGTVGVDSGIGQHHGLDHYQDVSKARPGVTS